MAQFLSGAMIGIAAILCTVPCHAQTAGAGGDVSGGTGATTPLPSTSSQGPVQNLDTPVIQPLRSAQPSKQPAYRQRPSLRAFPRIGERVGTRLFPRIGPAEDTETAGTAR